MFSEENIVQTLIAGTMISGFIGFVYGCYRITEPAEIEMKKWRAVARRDALRYENFKGFLAFSSRVIRKG
ncbi:hypothetical protein DHX103_14295 [Planococcus sp. X10-3]|uniref:hypothetical protein n=1 Tax=Planococcus sp. X10-3 TaxID=3061240 RepID=UPI003BAFBC35